MKIKKMRRRVDRCEKMGSLIDVDKEVERRKQLATVSLNQPNNVWIKG